MLHLILFGFSPGADDGVFLFVRDSDALQIVSGGEAVGESLLDEWLVVGGTVCFGDTISELLALALAGVSPWVGDGGTS